MLPFLVVAGALGIGSWALWGHGDDAPKGADAPAPTPPQVPDAPAPKVDDAKPAKRVWQNGNKWMARVGGKFASFADEASALAALDGE